MLSHVYSNYTYMSRVKSFVNGSFVDKILAFLWRSMVLNCIAGQKLCSLQLCGYLKNGFTKISILVILA